MYSFYNSTKVIHNIRHDLSQNQLPSINLSDINSSFLRETAPSIENNLQTPIRESSITNNEVPNNQINIENPSDNPTFKHNTPHIHTNIDTSKRKPESNDMLHFSKIDELEAKFDALKSPVTCEIFNLANKLDSLPLVLHETLKTLEKRDVSNSKLLQENFEYLRKETLSKDKLIKNLM